jgi:hypothetical protein
MQRMRLVSVGDSDAAIVEQERPDLVPTTSVGGHGVEEPGVAVPFADSTKFSALLPVGGLGAKGELKSGSGIAAEGLFFT